MLKLPIALGRPLTGAALWAVGVFPVILGVGFALWHRMRTAATAHYAPRLALWGGLLGLVLLILAHVSHDLNLEARELREEMRHLETRLRMHTVGFQDNNQYLLAEIAERKQSEDSLKKISGWLLQLQEEERRRIARDLHDSTTQSLAAIAINLERAQHLAQGHEIPDLGDVLLDSTDLVEQVTLEIRTLSYLLHPPMLSEFGLQHTLPRFVDGFSRRSRIAVDLKIQPDLGRLPVEIELALFRITQEALTNILRHSGSRTAGIALIRDSKSAVLEIKDQGCGIPPGVMETAEGMVGRLGVGIAGMQERVRQLGGKLEIVGRPNGTEIRAILPLAVTSAANPPSSSTAVAEAIRIVRPEVA
jgi:signal transduction histidine kinase